MYPDITHIVNAGLYFWNGKTGLLIDSLFCGKKYGFSDSPSFFQEQMKKREGIFSRCNDLLFTHLHADHYDETNVRMHCSCFPTCKIYGPTLGANNIFPKYYAEGIEEFDIGDYHIFSVKSIHDGKEFAEQQHKSYIVQSDGKNYFVFGDALIDDEFFDKIIMFQEMTFEAVFINLYQLYNPKTREILNRLSIKDAIVYHLPFPEDDQFRHWRLAEKMIPKMQKSMQARIQCMKPMTNIENL